ncbi:MAG TPA: PDZ domain-containing protein [Verrucomicrobiae bacterium]|nr:PDZ domain-containing protein [Verrucomicrobiae bacterium]
MSRQTIRTALACAVMLLAATAARAAGPVHYDLKFERPSTHLLDVTIQDDSLAGPAVDFAIPDWAPGSYYLENYSANVQRFRARTPDGKELAWKKTDSQTWRIDLAGAKSVVVEYQIYANTLQNNIAQYNELHAFIGGPSVWMYQVDGKDRPVTLSISVPQGWRVATGMEHTSAATFDAANYDTFADCPLEISDFQEKDFEVLGTKYHVIVHDVMGQKDFTQFTNDLQKIVATIVPLFQTVAGKENQAAPFPEYYFLFHIWPKAGGGLEHLDSTQIDFRTDWDSQDPAGGFANQYDLKLFVAAHEFFHAWNVKRLRPRPLGPFDYTRMVHTPSLWISEGLTSYYGELAVVRAGLITPQQYLDTIGKLITKFEQEPGRTERSIEDTSWDTWYNGTVKQDNNLQNTDYSYYDGGQIMGHVLDFAIRQATNNQKTLDDWMRLLYLRYALPNPGFEPEDPVRAANEVAGKDVSDLFRKYISGKDPIPYAEYFAYAGISVEKKLDPAKPWIGAATDKGDDGKAVVKNVIPGSPAEAADLEKNDVILAVDGRTADSDEAARILSAHKPGDTITFLVERLGRVQEISMKAISSPYYTYTLKPMDKMTPSQKAIYDSWIAKM